uniref:Protein phosphatase 1 regulatory inhibitor subunit 14D n=1 Tax=Seriola dumerili TaxID=41447 RepID=A0A3B4U694_SERDU
MASEPSTQSRVMFQATNKTEEPAHRKLGKLTVKYNRKDLQRRLDIEEWIDGQLHLLFDCEEEEIPELEIDIDELLELSDEGQRTRLHVRLYNSTSTHFLYNGTSLQNCKSANKGPPEAQESSQRSYTF